MIQQTSILVTGVTGFVGQAVLRQLVGRDSFKVAAALRSANSFDMCHAHVVGDFNENTNWSSALVGQDVVIHLAALAHINKDEEVASIAEYRRVNVEGTLDLAMEAAKAGVRRFIFISSIGVNGNINTRPFSEVDPPSPVALYAQTKYEAEQGLRAIQEKTEMDFVIIRPPLVYGPHAPGNFGKLMSSIDKGIPLPLGAIHNNQRSLVALDNLVDLIITCIEHPNATNQVFLAGDGQDLSTTELLQGLAKAKGKRSRLISVPECLLIFGAKLIGKEAMARSLLCSLQVDISKARDLLGWEPPITVEEGLRRCWVRSNSRVENLSVTS